MNDHLVTEQSLPSVTLEGGGGLFFMFSIDNIHFVLCKTY